MPKMLNFVVETARKSVRKDKQLMTYDFDKPIDRTGTCDVKHARLAEMWHRTDLIPLWVADMDWLTPPFIAEALGIEAYMGQCYYDVTMFLFLQEIRPLLS